MLSWILIAALGATWVAAAGAISAAMGKRPEGDERHPARTEDGWTLTVHRIPPAHGKARDEPPIVLGHGLMMNAACWSLSPQGSLTRALAAEGFDVWIAEYRCTDTALPPDGDDAPGRWDHAFDDIPRYDLPAILGVVQAVTGSPTASWVGHSMGGIVAYQYAQLHGCSGLHRMVTLGTPVRFGHLAGIAPFGLTAYVDSALSKLRTTSLRGLAAVGLPAIAVHAQPFMFFASNPAFNTRRERLALAHHAMQDNASCIPNWFFDRMRAGESQSPGAVDVPLAILGGSQDRLAPPNAVQPAFGEATAPVIGVKIYGEQSGQPTFGHTDLISSEAAVATVVPDLIAWLGGDAPELPGGRVNRSPSSPALKGP